MLFSFYTCLGCLDMKSNFSTTPVFFTYQRGSSLKWSLSPPATQLAAASDCNYCSLRSVNHVIAWQWLSMKPHGIYFKVNCAQTWGTAKSVMSLMWQNVNGEHSAASSHSPAVACEKWDARGIDKCFNTRKVWHHFPLHQPWALCLAHVTRVDVKAGKCPKG